MIAFNLVLSLIAIHPQTLFAGCLLTQLKGPNIPFNFLKRVYSNQGFITQAKSGNFSSGIPFSMRQLWNLGVLIRDSELDFINAIDLITVQQIYLIYNLTWFHPSFFTPTSQPPSCKHLRSPHVRKTCRPYFSTPWRPFRFFFWATLSAKHWWKGLQEPQSYW